jgi:hypothetical protein
MKRWSPIRDVGLFVGGVLGVAHETLLTKTDRPTLLILFAAMMGLPAFLRPNDEHPTTIVVREQEHVKEIESSEKKSIEGESEKP